MLLSPRFANLCSWKTLLRGKRMLHMCVREAITVTLLIEVHPQFHVDCGPHTHTQSHTVPSCFCPSFSLSLPLPVLCFSLIRKGRQLQRHFVARQPWLSVWHWFSCPLLPFAICTAIVHTYTHTLTHTQTLEGTTHDDNLLQWGEAR